MAQERRAKQRHKKELQKRISKVIVMGIPLIAVIALIIAIVVTSGSSDTDKNSDDASYSTDTSLTVEDGDKVNIDYVGSVDGVEFDGGSTQGKGTDLVIGSGLYIDDFEEQLIGHHPGDQVDVYATFPEDYGKEELNGKEALFEVTINGIYQ